MWWARKRLRCPKELLYNNLAYVRTAISVRRLLHNQPFKRCGVSTGGTPVCCQRTSRKRGERTLSGVTERRASPLHLPSRSLCSRLWRRWRPSGSPVGAAVCLAPPPSRRSLRESSVWTSLHYPLALRLLKATDCALRSAVWQRRWRGQKKKKKSITLTGAICSGNM